MAHRILIIVSISRLSSRKHGGGMGTVPTFLDSHAAYNYFCSEQRVLRNSCYRELFGIRNSSDAPLEFLGRSFVTPWESYGTPFGEGAGYDNRCTAQNTIQNNPSFSSTASSSLPLALRGEGKMGEASGHSAGDIRAFPPTSLYWGMYGVSAGYFRGS